MVETQKHLRTELGELEDEINRRKAETGKSREHI